MEEEDEIGQKLSTKFAQSIIEQVNRSDIEAMVQVQRDMLSRYEKTNEMLINFNLLSLSRFEATSTEFKNHTQVLYDMKKDLDNVFRRIRQLKQRLSQMYPEAFSVCSDVYNMMSDEEDDGVEQNKDGNKTGTKHSKDPDQKGANIDPDPRNVQDGMNDMLDSHRNQTLINGELGNKGKHSNNSDNGTHIISSSDNNDSSHSGRADEIKPKRKNTNGRELTEEKNSVVENG